ncbi:DUF6728 family protein [Emticicia sp. 17c]|uniref:DUF6728 family protein n=1 Tax=Emticicia sp. 17c TaxID=3127704 RepID=UPI00301CE2F2
MLEKIKHYLAIGPVFAYFVRVFRKDKEGKYPHSFNLKMMHGINKISIIMFLICVIIMVTRCATR